MSDKSRSCPKCGGSMDFRLGNYECSQCDHHVSAHADTGRPNQWQKQTSALTGEIYWENEDGNRLRPVVLGVSGKTVWEDSDGKKYWIQNSALTGVDFIECSDGEAFYEHESPLTGRSSLIGTLGSSSTQHNSAVTGQELWLGTKGSPPGGLLPPKRSPRPSAPSRSLQLPQDDDGSIAMGCAILGFMVLVFKAIFWVFKGLYHGIAWIVQSIASARSNKSDSR